MIQVISARNGDDDDEEGETESDRERERVSEICGWPRAVLVEKSSWELNMHVSHFWLQLFQYQRQKGRGQRAPPKRPLECRLDAAATAAAAAIAPSDWHLKEPTVLLLSHRVPMLATGEGEREIIINIVFQIDSSQRARETAGAADTCRLTREWNRMCVSSSQCSVRCLLRRSISPVMSTAGQEKNKKLCQSESSTV